MKLQGCHHSWKREEEIQDHKFGIDINGHELDFMQKHTLERLKEKMSLYYTRKMSIEIEALKKNVFSKLSCLSDLNRRTLDMKIDDLIIDKRNDWEAVYEKAALKINNKIIHARVSPSDFKKISETLSHISASTLSELSMFTEKMISIINLAVFNYAQHLCTVTLL
jgi:hypothetical protein